MKTTANFLIILVTLSLVLSGCKKDDSTGSSSGSLSGNTINAKIESWSLGSDKKILVYDNEAELLGESPISATGSFSITLTEPIYHFLISEDMPASITMSDPTAEMATVDRFYVYDNSGNYFGTLLYGNETAFQEKGAVSIFFCHLTKKTTIKGNTSGSGYKQIFDVNFKAGWNVFVDQVTAVDPVITYKYSNNVPSSAKWYFSSK